MYQKRTEAENQSTLAYLSQGFCFLKNSESNSNKKEQKAQRIINKYTVEIQKCQMLIIGKDY